MNKMISLAAAFLLIRVTYGQEPGTFELFQRISNEEKVAFAPTALVDALSLLYYGSSGETESRFNKVLFPEISRIEAAQNAKVKKRTITGYKSIGSLWFSNRVSINELFLSVAQENWEFHTERISMRTDQVVASRRVNEWFKIKTNGYFDKVVTSLDFENEPDMFGVIITAFVSQWEKEYFKGSDTSDESFYLSEKDKFDVRMMKATDYFQYYENDNLQGIKIGYAGNATSILLLLPKDAKEFDEIKKQINLELYKEFLENMKPERVNIWLPKVNYTCKIEWHTMFRNSLLSPAFEAGSAEFLNINNNIPEPLFLSSLVQEVMIRWDERGTEARSITSFAADPFSAVPEPPKLKMFIANHPFFYFILNDSDKNVLFSGIINSQEQITTP